MIFMHVQKHIFINLNKTSCCKLTSVALFYLFCGALYIQSQCKKRPAPLNSEDCLKISS